MSEIARHPTHVMKPERSALVSQTINYLRDQISEGRWPTGTRLPVESELLQELRISRVILRQAMQALVHVGMVETIQGSGTFVRATNELDAVLIRYLAGENELAILEVRQALEITAAGLAAERATPGHIETMVRAVESAELAVAEGDISSAAQASTQFHVAVVAASGNPVLAHFYGAIEQATTKTMVETSSDRPAECFQREHREIIEAVAAADPDRARNLAGDHLDPVLIAARGQQTPST